MNDQEDLHEFSGATPEEAIENGLKALGISRDEAIIVVIEEGSKGLFGLGSKPAVVHVRPSDPERYGAAYKKPAVESAAESIPQPAAAKSRETTPRSPDFAGTEDEDELTRVTRETVAELLEKMHIRAEVTARMDASDEHSGRAAVMVDISGDDLSILIGRKAETLDALEYITRLIVGKEVSSSVLINLDVQGYKKRKEQRLRRIARTVARQAIETGRRQYLEPMSPAERRIIHIELRDHPEVYTESTGEGHRRKVTISLREG
ncbi:MAG TPA: RNA-binding cell elongation regulator Jag/EloR [Anaerolineales bacterium]|nr:RNA-binding cell elongation regulator Jag/EloR [Anaerolineales bacterium]